MSLFDNPEFEWRETYFVLFPEDRRPNLADVQKVLLGCNESFELKRALGTDEGKFEALTVYAEADCSALDISYVEGEEVIEETNALLEEMPHLEKILSSDKIERLTGRLDIMHFEHITSTVLQDEEELFDPSGLLLAMEALKKLTGGIGIDPQSGSVM